MADVKKIDIDGVQWDIKDQEARDRLVKLEAKTIISEEVLAQNGKSYISLVTIDGIRFFSIHFEGNITVSSIGDTVLRFTPISDFDSVVRGFVGLDKNDGSGRIPANIDVNFLGTVRVFPIIENQYNGKISPSTLFGDCFIRIV